VFEAGIWVISEDCEGGFMLEAVKVLAAVSLIPPNGHEKALEAITMSADIENRCRFLPIVQGLKSIGNEVLRASRFFVFSYVNIWVVF